MQLQRATEPPEPGDPSDTLTKLKEGLHLATELTVRLRARAQRGAVNARRPANLKRPQGRNAHPGTFAQGRDALDLCPGRVVPRVCK